MNTMYRIIAKCNPYNAHTHYKGGKVLKYDNTTPIEWVWKDGYSTRADARAEFAEWGGTEGNWLDDREIDRICKQATIDLQQGYSDIVGEGEEYTREDWLEENSWYEGAGFYHPESNERLYAPDVDEDTYHDDVMTFVIESYEED